MAKPTLALIPASQGSKLFSVLPSSGVGDFDFSRGSAATRINSQGLIETVVSGQSRLDYPMIDGVQKGCPHHILEPARTQLVQYSEDFSNAYWTKEKTSITSNAVISPDGTLNASKLFEDSSNGLHRTYTDLITTVQGDDYTTSIFAKKGGRNIFGIQISNGAQPFVWFNLDKGIVELQESSIVGKIESLPNGWYKCTATWNSSSATNDRAFIQLAKSISSTTYTGDGTSGVYIWGAMLEVGSFPTSYIPNNGNAAGVTRSAETASGAGNSTTFNDSEGVLMAELSALTDDGSYRLISISDGTQNQRITILYDITDNKIYVQCVNGTTQAFIPFVPQSISNNNKVAMKYKANDFALWVNGFEVGTDTNGSIPIGLDTLSFDRGDLLSPFYGKTKQIQYYNSALTDSEIEQLTSWTSFTDMANGQQYSIK